MEVSEVKDEDKKACAALLKALQASEITIKVIQAKELNDAVSWLQSLAQKLVLSGTVKTETPPNMAGVKIHRAKEK